MADGRFSPSGEHLLSSLVEFIDHKGPELMSGKVALELHPRALEYVTARAQHFDELQSLKASAPTEYFRGAFNQLEDYKRLEKLQHVLQRVKRLRVHSIVYKCRDPTRVNLTGLWSLASIELRSCDLSTSVIAGLEALQGTLTSISCSDSLEKLQHLLAPYVRTDPAPPQMWTKLQHLSCTHNLFRQMDFSLTLVPTLRTLCLANNNIAELGNLHMASALVELDLSHNCITSVMAIAQCPGPLQKLRLQGNAIRSTRGLDSLKSLVELDLRFNLLARLHEVATLAGLSALKVLGLEGNPLAYAPFYRIDALACLRSQSDGLWLDGRAPHKQETDALAVQSLFGASDVPHDLHLMAWYINQVDHWASHMGRRAPTDYAAAAPLRIGCCPHPSSPRSSQASVSRSSHRAVRRVVDLDLRTQSQNLREADQGLSTTSVFRPFMRSSAHANFEANRYMVRRRHQSSGSRPQSRRTGSNLSLTQLELSSSPHLGQPSSLRRTSRALSQGLDPALGASVSSQASSSLGDSSASSLASSRSVSPARQRPSPARQRPSHANPSTLGRSASPAPA